MAAANLDRASRPKCRQRGARCRLSGKTAVDRHRRARCRCPPLLAWRAPGASPGRLVRHPAPLNNNRPSCCTRLTCGRSRLRKPYWRGLPRTASFPWWPTNACAPRPPDRARHRQQIPVTARTAPACGQVLLPPAGWRKLVRPHPAPAQRTRHHHPRIPGRTGADRRPPGHRQLLALPAGTLRRARHPGHRQGGRRAQLRRHLVRLQPRPGQARQAAAGPVQLRRPAGSGRHTRHGPARHAGRAEILIFRGHAWTLSTARLPCSWRHKNNSISISRKNR